jgi:exopolysaccharide biosynthesis predicted pyruvyltransferase EpsI
VDLDGQSASASSTTTAIDHGERRQLEPERPEHSFPFTDLVFFLRDDDESVFAPQRNNESIRGIIETVTTASGAAESNSSTDREQHHEVTFSIVDWNDRLLMYDTDDYYFTETAIRLVGSGRVVITDRLHGSILSYLSGVPFVYLDNVSRKINQTLQVAFGQWDGCSNGEHAMYLFASTIHDATVIGIEFLSKYQLA